MNKEFSLEEEAYLLQVIKGDGNLEPLTGKHSYIDISDEINNLIRAGYAELNKESLMRVRGTGTLTHTPYNY